MNALNFRLIINEQDEVEGVSIIEYQLAVIYGPSIEKRSEEGRVKLTKSLGLISKETNDAIIAILKKQKWKAGTCNGEKKMSCYKHEFPKN